MHKEGRKLTSDLDAACSILEQGVFALKTGRSYVHEWRKVQLEDLEFTMAPQTSWCVVEDKQEKPLRTQFNSMQDV